MHVINLKSIFEDRKKSLKVNKYHMGSPYILDLGVIDDQEHLNTLSQDLLMSFCLHKRYMLKKYFNIFENFGRHLEIINFKGHC